MVKFLFFGVDFFQLLIHFQVCGAQEKISAGRRPACPLTIKCDETQSNNVASTSFSPSSAHLQSSK